jgi:NADH dehydrogenase [ubiquinone] 1 alpha subcomplex assembly factor 7
VSGAPGDRFRRLIADAGPISVARFMAESNAHYYASRDPLGVDGDFTTAPEISQMFGELVGLWLADLWRRAGAPANPIYAELGPGRGTLAADALRAMHTAALRPSVDFVEGSPTLRAHQRARIEDARFHESLASVPESGPLLLVANEFLDALPVRQLVRTEEGWRERTIAIEGARLVFAAGPYPVDLAIPERFADLPAGTIVELNPAAAAVVEETAQRLMRQGGAALFIDYGPLVSGAGSTLQAVRAHRQVDPLAAPGEADLTAHVDFEVLAAIARRAGCRVQLASQGEWLTGLGLDQRAQMLMRAAPEASPAITAARDRLVTAAGMGALFKVMAVTAPAWPEGAGFAS